MHVKRLHEMLESLTECAESAIKNDQTHVGKYPISEVIDMIKDLSEAEYHCKITNAMDEEKEEEKKEDEYALRRLKEEYGEDDGRRYYDEWRYANGRFAPKGRGTRKGYTPSYHYLISPKSDYMSPYEYDRDMDRHDGRMYYTPEVHSSSKPGNVTVDEHDRKMYGRSGMSRKHYMDTKHTHADNTPESKQMRLKELENYLNELDVDMAEMITDANNEEKTMLRHKLQNISNKIL